MCEHEYLLSSGKALRRWRRRARCLIWRSSRRRGPRPRGGRQGSRWPTCLQAGLQFMAKANLVASACSICDKCLLFQ